MVHIIVIAHAEIANSFAYCAEHILAKRIDNLHTLAVKKTEEVDSIIANARHLIERIGNDRQILILADIFGATPSNIASRLVIENKIELITGLNLPMLIRAISYSKEELTVCVKKVLDGAHSGIIYINHHSQEIDQKNDHERRNND